MINTDGPDCADETSLIKDGEDLVTADTGDLYSYMNDISWLKPPHTEVYL